MKLIENYTVLKNGICYPNHQCTEIGLDGQKILCDHIEEQLTKPKIEAFLGIENMETLLKEHDLYFFRDRFLTRRNSELRIKTTYLRSSKSGHFLFVIAEDEVSMGNFVSELLGVYELNKEEQERLDQVINS